MRFYLAYKYSNNKNKEGLKQKLEDLAQKINEWGHDVFILGRDVKKWKHVHLGSFKLIPVIYHNMKSCDLLVAYVDSKSFSKGLMFEIMISKLLGKKSYLLLEDGTKSGIFSSFFNQTHHLSNANEVKPDMFS